MKVISRLEHRQKMLTQIKSSNPALKLIVLKDLIAHLEGNQYFWIDWSVQIFQK